MFAAKIEQGQAKEGYPPRGDDERGPLHGRSHRWRRVDMLPLGGDRHRGARRAVAADEGKAGQRQLMRKVSPRENEQCIDVSRTAACITVCNFPTPRMQGTTAKYVESQVQGRKEPPTELADVLTKGLPDMALNIKKNLLWVGDWDVVGRMVDWI